MNQYANIKKTTIPRAHAVFAIPLWLLLCAMITTASCASKNTAEAEHFRQHAVRDFEILSLENGIKLVVKKTDASHIRHIRIIAEGGTAFIPQEKAGLEDAVFSMMTKGSQKYSAEKIRETLFQKQASFSGSAYNDSSVLSLTCLDYYFDDLLDMLLDCFLHPSFPQKEFDELILFYKDAVQKKEHDPFSLLLQTAWKTAAENHPYRSGIMTNDSINNIHISDLVKHHAVLLNKERITVVAVGNFDSAHLKSTLDFYLGALPSLSYSKPKIPLCAVNAEAPVHLHSPAAKGTAFSAQMFSFPRPSDPDYYAACIAADLYDTVLFNVVREQYGACYSIGNSVFSSGGGLGVLTAYRISDIANIEAYIGEAKNIFRAGKVITEKDGKTGTFKTESAENMLEGAKNSRITSLYSSVDSCSGTAAQISASLITYGNPYEYLNAAEKIRNVSMQDVINAFETYWINKPSRLFVVTE
ncbi:MAG: insulinase family protein [Bacteroides sp.]|nr:insulinase family protein [Prevotella sp.]MCM1408239.1 insulinase family protein [Treponema brennaborense]MCM1469563.1 insulinase family protein [Bacteroides sp.]